MINVHGNVKAVIQKSGLDLNCLTSIGADNTNVNMGHRHSVFSPFSDEFCDLIKGKHVKRVSDSFYSNYIFFHLGNCYCHIVHNGVKWSHQHLTINIEKFLIMAYTHLSRSAKRIEQLKSYYMTFTSKTFS